MDDCSWSSRKRFLNVLQKLAGADFAGMLIQRSLLCAGSHGLQLFIGGAESSFNIFRTGHNAKFAPQIEERIQSVPCVRDQRSSTGGGFKEPA